jgi:hypothetical protein
MYCVNAPLPGSTGPAERHALTRLPIFAIFHGIAHERGVPPSFTGTLIVRSNVPPQTNNVLYRVQASSGSGQLPATGDTASTPFPASPRALGRFAFLPLPVQRSLTPFSSLGGLLPARVLSVPCPVLHPSLPACFPICGSPPRTTRSPSQPRFSPCVASVPALLSVFVD